MAAESSFKNMTLCLTAVCLVCSALLGIVYSATEGIIEKTASEKLVSSISQVLPDFDKLGDKKSVDVDGRSFDYYDAFDSAGNSCGVAVISSATGFGGNLQVLVGIDASGNIYNTEVLSHSETPGLGAKCSGDFKEQFRGWNPSEKELSVKKDGGDVDAITAATITSRAYISAIESAVRVFIKYRDNCM